MSIKRKKIKHHRKNLLNSFGYAFQGLYNSFKSEGNMKIHIFMMIVVILFGILLKISLLEWFVCIILFAIVIAGELFNTAIETVVDMISPNINEKAKLAKDISAGGVLVLAIGAFLIGLFIFIPKILSIFIK